VLFFVLVPVLALSVFAFFGTRYAIQFFKPALRPVAPPDVIREARRPNNGIQYPQPPKAGGDTKADEPHIGVNPPDVPKAKIGEIHFADDAAYKKSDFWLEQEFELVGDANRDGKTFVKLFAGLDEKTLRSISVTVSGWEAVLTLDEGKEGAKKELARAKLPKFPAGKYDLGVLWRSGELSAWIGPAEVLEYCPPDRPAAESILKLDSAAQVLSENVNLGPRHAVAFNTIRFDDNFMRTAPNDVWKPAAGRWEMTAMAFAERSANPFSLRCAFDGKKPFDDDEIFGKGKRERGEEYGIGVQLSFAEGTPHIVRITGGSPAAHAGLAEDDIFVEVNGRAVGSGNTMSLYQQLMMGAGDLRLKMYRPGDKSFHEYTITREAYKWGVVIEGEPIAPVLPPSINSGDEYALIMAGEQGWSDYEAEVAVKPLGGGGFGLAVAALSEKDYVLFRWRGPLARGETGTGKTNVLQLVRVKDGKETVLAEKPAHYRPYEFYRVGVNWSGDKISCLIDKNEMLSASVPDAKRGKVALYALKGDPVFFDDVHVTGDRSVTAAWHLAERSLNEIFAFEDDMEIWANPALEWERDIKTGWSIHNQRFPGDQGISISKPRFKDLEVALFCGDDPEAPNCPRLTIRNGVAEISGNGLVRRSLSVGAGPFQHVGVNAGSFGARATIDGKKLETEWDPIKPHFGMPGVKMSGERVAIRGLKNLGEPSAVRVTSTGTMEYTFDNAPSDWKVLSGRWGLLNKWICDPRWSWFGGRTKTVAAIWNKHIFSGDISVDAHVALLMVRDDPPYERPGDHNITICGDGVNLDSGYTLIFGGDINSWTRLYRKGKLVAEATHEDYRIFSDRIRHPDKPQLHQRWFHLKLEKIGSAISFYRDGLKAFTFTDPDPLPDGRVAFWTFDNSFLLSRLRIAHGGARPAPFEDGRSALFEDSKAINMFDGETPTAMAREELPKAIADSLTTPANVFRSATAEPIPLVPEKQWPADEADPKAPAVAHAYHVTNGIGGGPFALQFKSRMIDVEREGVVRFAYRIDPGTLIDFYLVPAGQGDFNPRHQNSFRWRMSGPKDDNSGTLSEEFAPMVGEIPGVVADGKWHTVQVDLEPSWRDFWKSRGRAFPIRLALRPMFGNLCNQGYLLAGMNGNHAGATYSATEVKPMTPQESVTDLPKIARAVWPFDADGDGHSVAVYFDDPGGSGILPETVRVSINGALVPNELQQPNSALSYGAMARCLRIDLLKLRDAGVPFPPAMKDGDKFALKIEPNYSDRAGNSNTPGFTSEWIFNAELARKANKPVIAPPLVLKRAGSTDFLPGSGALNLSDTTLRTGEQITTRVQASDDAPPWAPPGQTRSVEVVATGELPAMGFDLRGVRYDLQNYPYLDIEYKVPRETPFNLHLSDENGAMHALLLVDLEDGRDSTSGDIQSRFGPPADFVADGTWRRSTVPLLKLFTDANGGPNRGFSTNIIGMSLHDNGWRGGRRGLHYWIHRIRPIPAGRPADIMVSWAPSDITGIADVETSVDDSPTGDPSGKHELEFSKTLAQSLAKSGKTLKDGWNYVHLRAKNNAGVWSQSEHAKFYLDTTPPRIVKTEPPDGGKLSGQTVRIFLDEPHSIDFSAVTVTIDGQAVQQFMNFDSETGVLTFNALSAGLQFTPGTKSKVEINGLADKLGNKQTAPYTFSFDCDNKPGGAKGPEMKAVAYAAATEHAGYYRQYDMELSFGLSFEEYVGHVHAMRDCKMEWLNEPALAAEGNRALRFTCVQDDGDPQIMMHKNPWFIDRLPLLNFEYKCDPGFKVDLQIESFGVWYSIRFTGTGHAPNEGKNIGAIPGVIPDGTWRHASVDLRALLDAAGVRMPERIVDKIVFSANGEDGNVRGATLSIDNFDMTPPAGGYWRNVEPMLKWSAAKAQNEIGGYAVVVDQIPTTIPKPEVTHRDTGERMVGRTGVWYAHVRACDQAGNWGGDKTIRIDFGQQNARVPRFFQQDDN